MAEKKPITVYLDKSPTELQARFVDYLKQEVGYDPSKAKTKEEAFAEGVRLSTAMRMVFQASDFNRNGRATAKEQRESAAPTGSGSEATASTKAMKTAKAPATKTAKPAPTKARMAAKPPAAAKTTTRRARAVPAPATAAEAPF